MLSKFVSEIYIKADEVCKLADNAYGQYVYSLELATVMFPLFVYISRSATDGLSSLRLQFPHLLQHPTVAVMHICT
jgi:hypothetical protein